MIETEGRLIKDIHRDLVASLGGLVDEYFHLANSWGDRLPGMNEQGFNLSGGSTWPNNVKWIACYAVTGGSEGHYIHIDVIYTDQRRDMVFMGKTFQGMQHARCIADRCADELGA